MFGSHYSFFTSFSTASNILDLFQGWGGGERGGHFFKKKPCYHLLDTLLTWNWMVFANCWPNCFCRSCWNAHQLLSYFKWGVIFCLILLVAIWLLALTRLATCAVATQILSVIWLMRQVRPTIPPEQKLQESRHTLWHPNHKLWRAPHINVW